MRDRKKGYGFQNKILCILTLIISATVLVLTIFFGYYIRKNSVEAMVGRYENITKNLLVEFMDSYNKIDGSIDNFILNDYVQKSLMEEELEAMDREMVIRALAFLGNEADYYAYIDNRGNLYSQGAAPERAGQMREQWMEAMGKNYSKTKLVLVQEEGRLFVCRYIRPVNENRESGILIMRLKADFMEKELQELEEEACYYIINAENEICLFKGQEKEEIKQRMMALSAQSSTEYRKEISRSEGLLSIQRDLESGYTAASHIEYRVLMSTYYQMLLITAVVFAGILAIIFFISLKASGWLAKPIREINDYMSDFENNNMENYIELHTNTELDSIGNSYNQMLGRIRKLVEDVRYRESELRKSEINSLIYQINPHFLYNTLDVIYMLARMNQEKEIMQMVQSLTKLLRINLSNGADIITIKDELAYARAYMDIMKIRNDNLFSYEILCEEAALKYPVMKLILQPVIENSIKHGFKNINEGGHIGIKVERKEEVLEFSVENNGECMKEDEIGNMNARMEIPIEEAETGYEYGKGGYGVRNVMKRLRLHYSEKAEFFYETEKGYTVCHIKIPLQIGREVHNEDQKEG